MLKSITLLTVSFLILLTKVESQKIYYSQPDRDDARTINFEIIGKMNGNVLIYKNYRDQHFISVLDPEMKQLDKKKLDFLPEKPADVEFLQYPDFFYMFYQYQKRNIYYAVVAKIDAMGNKIGNPVILDTTSDVGLNNTSKIYSYMFSENKQKIMIFKVGSRSDKAHLLTSVLLDKELSLIKRSKVLIAMPERNDFLTEFALSNDGDLFCLKASGSSSNDNINKILLLSKTADADQMVTRELKTKSIFLDDLKLKVDNVNNHIVITSFYSKQRRGNIDGLYYTVWDKLKDVELANISAIFSDDFRADAKGDGNLKMAFNDFYIKNIVLKKDGGFFIAAEAAYSTSRGNQMNRWDYLYGSPFFSPMDYYSYYLPPGTYPWGRYNTFNNNTVTRYFADNIVLMSFDASGKMEWSNVIRKSQFDDNTDNFIGYAVLNGGDKAHFIFNVQDKRAMILSDQTLNPDGQVDRNPTFKNMDLGYEFMPRHAKQVGLRQLIIPCQYKNSTCFAKVEFN